MPLRSKRKHCAVSRNVQEEVAEQQPLLKTQRSGEGRMQVEEDATAVALQQQAEEVDRMAADDEEDCSSEDIVEGDAVFGDSLDTLDCNESIPGSAIPLRIPDQGEDAAVYGNTLEGEVEYICHPDELLHSGLVGLSLDDNEMMGWMYERELFYQPRINYVAEGLIDSERRAKLIDWLQHVSDDMRLRRETFHLAMNLFDRFLAEDQRALIENRVNNNNDNRYIQLVGVVSLFIAAKNEEINEPQADAFIWQSDCQYTRAQIFVMEARILSKLKWFILPKTCWSWLKLFIGRTVHMIQHLFQTLALQRSSSRYAELSALLEEVLLAENIFRCMEMIDFAALHPNFLNFKPSQVVAVALKLVFNPISELLPEICQIELSDLDECCDWMESLRFDLEGRFQEVRGENSRMEINEFMQKQQRHPQALNTMLDMFV